VKELNDILTQFRLDQDDVNIAKNQSSQTDTIAKHALDTLNRALNADPGVQKANAKLETDREGLIDKINALRKQQGLDSTWDWDFNQGKFIQAKPPTPLGAAKER
jgi:hypothetical protein